MRIANAASSPATARASRSAGSAEAVMCSPPVVSDMPVRGRQGQSGDLAGPPDHLSLRVGKQPESHAGHGCGRLDYTAALSHGGLQGSDDLLDADEKGHQRPAALHRADAAWHAAFDAAVDVGVAGNPAVRKRPAEQLAVKRPRRIRFGRPDLEMDHRAWHLNAPLSPNKCLRPV